MRLPVQTPNPGDAVTRIDAGQRMGSLASSSSSRVFRLFHAATAVNPAKCIQDTTWVRYHPGADLEAYSTVLYTVSQSAGDGQ